MVGVKGNQYCIPSIHKIIFKTWIVEGVKTNTFKLKKTYVWSDAGFVQKIICTFKDGLVWGEFIYEKHKNENKVYQYSVDEFNKDEKHGVEMIPFKKDVPHISDLVFYRYEFEQIMKQLKDVPFLKWVKCINIFI